MWGAIKKAINSNLNKSLDVLIQEKTTETNGKVDSADAKIGVTNNTGGTASAGSVFAKLNKLLTDWTTTRAGYLDNINTNVEKLLNGRVVKSIQRGTLTFQEGVAVQVISHNAVSLDKSFLILNAVAVSINTSAKEFPYISARTSNSFSLELSMKNTDPFQSVARTSWQLIEFY